MASGVDKLVLISSGITDSYLELAREKGIKKWGYGHILDLSQTEHKLPIILHCDGLHNGVHKIEFKGVARLGLRHTLEMVKTILGHLSQTRIYRIDFCVDLLGFSLWDLASICYINRAQTYQVYRSRSSDSVYLQRSDIKTVLLYDKGRLLKAAGSPWAPALNQEMVRIEVQLKGSGVPFKKLRHLHSYLDFDLLAGLEFRRLVPPSKQRKPLRSMAAAYLAAEIEQFGLHALLKRYPSSQRPYFKKIFLEDIEGSQVPDIRKLMRKGIEDWLNDRIRFPRPLFRGMKVSDERS